MNQETIDIIENSQKEIFNGNLPFPDVVKKLMDANIGYYYTDLITLQKIYYATDGSVYTSKLPYKNSDERGNTFSEKDVIKAVRTIQRGEIEYPEFLDLIIKAGVVNYTAFLLGRQVHYIGAKGEMYVESFEPLSDAIKVKSIDHVNFFVNDLEESIQFYSKVFGFKIVEDSREQNILNKLGTPYVIMGIKGCAYLAIHQALQQGDGQQQIGSVRIAHFGFHVDHFDALITRLKDFAVTFHIGEKVFEWPHSRSVYILDPNGHEIELVERFGGRE